MSIGKDYAPCPCCAANNVTHREVCWRCGNTLPFTVGIDGKLRSNRSATPNYAVVDRIVENAETFDLEAVRKERESQARATGEVVDTPGQLRAWLWLQRRRERPTGA